MRQYKSRLSQVEEQKSIKSAVVFGGLTILIVILAVFFGIQAFSHFTNLFVKDGSTTTDASTTLPPPNIETLPKNTNEKTIIVKGSSSPNTKIKITFNDSSDETISDSDGNFQANVGLTKGINTIYAQAIDEKNNESPKSASYLVNYSTEVPNLTISSPQNNQSFYGSGQKTVKIEGSTDNNNSVTVNDRVAIVDSSGKFSLNYEIGDGDNTLKVISTDQAGNKKEIDLKLTYNP